MPIIAPQHAWKDKDHRPRPDWPEDCYVQWGSGGVVLGERPYRTAFFEAFPKVGGFIRGEGETLDDAENAAFNKFIKERACVHAWSRKSYTNGGTICRKCNAFQVTMQPIPKLGAWRAPLNSFEVMRALEGGLAPSWPAGHPERERDDKSCRRAWLRFRLHGYILPRPPVKPDPDSLWELSAYGKECRHAFLEQVCENGGIDAIIEDTSGGIFDQMTVVMIRREMEDWLQERESLKSPESQGCGYPE